MARLTSMTRRMRLFMLGCATALLGTLVHEPPAAAQNRTENTFDDWRVICSETSEDEQRCRMRQILLHTESERPLFRWVIVADQDNQFVSVLSAPLGVSLQPGLQLSVAGGDSVSAAFNTCDRRWCHARQPLSEEFRSEMASGEPVEIIFVNPRGQRLRMEATTRGFGEAIDFMEAQLAE